MLDFRERCRSEAGAGLESEFGEAPSEARAYVERRLELMQGVMGFWDRQLLAVIERNGAKGGRPA